MPYTNADKTDSAQESTQLKREGIAEHFSDNRGTADAQLQLQGVMNNNPRSASQRAMQTAISSSPVVQEKHLPRDASHVRQEAQGRVKPAVQMKTGVQVNDDAGLEHEANVMGDKALASNATQLLTTKNAIVAPGNASASGKPLQKVLIAGVKMTFPQIATVIAGLDISKGVKQKFLVDMVNDANDFPTEGEAHSYILGKAKDLGAPVNHEEIKARGDATEAAAAEVIGGQVNRGKGNRDVEWRFISKDEASELKTMFEINSDQELFERWKEIVPKAKAKGLDYSDAASTPVDAYSAHTLALAGGPIKFNEGTNVLKPTAAVRVKQLIMLAEKLGYRPVLVFSETVTCAQCDAVAAEFSIDVIHMGAGTH